ncbi:MAG: rod shape-determining protein MreC [Pseudomonadota bacterium]|nr:rod shape-determining protein MreC [Pseudomonadota bacterium]
MALAGGAMNRPSARDLAPGPRFFFFALISLVLMYFDQKDGWGNRIRYGLQAAAYPIQVTIGSPRMLWSATSGFLRTRGELERENDLLREQSRQLALRAMRIDALERENARLRDLREAPPPLVKQWQLVDVVNSDLGRLRQRLVVNQGDNAGLFRSQSIIDADGLVGQLARVGPWSSEVMLITDPEAGVPVEVVRSGVRSIAVGMGSEDELQLPLLPATADVMPGDLLVTSGLGGVFPAGVPVGTITESRRNPDELLAFVRARPAARMGASRQLLALWFDAASTAAPADPKLSTSLPPVSVAQPVTTQPARPAETAPGPAEAR